MTTRDDRGLSQRSPCAGAPPPARGRLDLRGGDLICAGANRLRICAQVSLCGNDGNGGLQWSLQQGASSDQTDRQPPLVACAKPAVALAVVKLDAILQLAIGRAQHSREQVQLLDRRLGAEYLLLDRGRRFQP